MCWRKTYRLLANCSVDAMKIGEPRHFLWLKGIISTVLILNMLDGVLTLVWVFSERAEEKNPLMAQIVSHPVLFITLKMALVGMGSYLLWRFRKKALAVVAIFIAFFVYYWILLLHLKALNLDILQNWFGT